jgi:hypothetical protein
MYRIRINILSILVSPQDRGVLEPDVPGTAGSFTPSALLHPDPTHRLFYRVIRVSKVDSMRTEYDSHISPRI